MTLSFFDHIPSIAIVLAIFGLMLLSNLIGIRLGVYRVNNKLKDGTEEIGATESGLLGLLALLLAFTFGAANTRHDKRFEVFIKEADQISTVILRADLYSDSIRLEFRKNLVDYVEARLQFYKVGDDLEDMMAALYKSDSISMQIWNRAVLLSKVRENIIPSNQMLPAINSMILVAKEQTALTNARVPDLILSMLFLLCLGSSFVLGYGLRKKIDWVVVYGFSLMISLCIYVILDLDRPRGGLISMEKAEQEIFELRKMFLNK